MSTTHLFCDDEIARLNARIREIERELEVQKGVVEFVYVPVRHMTERADRYEKRCKELEAELADWQRMRNEAMAVATSNRARINELEARIRRQAAMIDEQKAVLHSSAFQAAVSETGTKS